MADPVFANVDNTPVYVENGAPVVLDNDMTLTDPDGDPFNGTQLGIFRGDTGVLGGSGTLAFVGADVVVGGVTIGTFVDTAGSRIITFNADATNARVNLLLQQLTYANSSDAPPETQDIAFNFANPDFATASVFVDLVPINDTPAVTVAATAGYQAGTAGTPLSGAVDIVDPDAPLIASATVRLANGIAGDILSADVGTSGIVASYDAATRTLTLAGARTQAEYEEVLATVTYSSSLADPTDGGANPTRTIEWQIDDGEATNNLSNVATTTLGFGPGTVVPYLDLDQGAGGTSFATAFGEQGAPVAIADFDDLILAGNTQITSATIVLTNRQAGDTMAIAGVLPAGIGATVDTTDPGQITVTLTGAASAAAYQTALRQVVFGNANDNLDPTARDISVTVSNGNASNTAHATININVVDDFASTAEDTVLIRSAAAGVLANDSDPDGGLFVTTGDAVTSGGGQIEFDSDGSYVYAPAPGFAGRDTVTYTASDSLGQTMSATLTIDVAPTADEPQVRMGDSGLTGSTPVGIEHVESVAGTESNFLGNVIALASGGYAVGHSNVSATNSTDRDVIVRTYGADGTPVSGPVQLDGAETASFMLMTPLTAGGFAAAWFVDVTDFRVRIIQDNGAAVTAQMPFAGTLGSLTTLANGNFAVTSSDPTGTFVRILDPQGAVVAGPIQITTIPGNRVASGIAPDSDGGFIVAWRVDLGGGTSSVVAQRYNADGSLDGPEITVRGPEAGAISSGPVLASLADGRFMVAWGEPTDGANPVNQTIHAQVMGVWRRGAAKRSRRSTRWRSAPR